MSDQDNALFSQEANQPNDTATDAVNLEPSQNPFGDLLGGITNEDGTQKYADVAAALSSMPHAQTHISTLEKDNTQLKEELAKAKAAEELLRKSVNQSKPEQAALSQDQLFDAINNVIEAKTQASTKASNLDSVGKIFSDTYGDKAKSELQAIADANGVGIDFIKNLAETSPKAVLKLAGLSDTPTQTLSKSSGSINTDSLSNQPRPQQAKSVMGAASTKDVVSAWRLAGETVKHKTN